MLRLLLLSITTICCSGQGTSVVLVDVRGASENISFAGDEELNYTEHLKQVFSPTDVGANVISIIDAGCSIVPPFIVPGVPTISCCRSYLTEYTGSLYTIVPSDELIVPGLLSVLNYHQWRLVKIFTENSTQFNKLSSDIMLQAGIDVEEDKVNDSSTLDGSLFSGNPHVFILNTGYTVGLNILCEAFNGNRYYPNYAWILLNWSIDQLKMANYSQLNCTQSDINVVLNRALLLVPYPDGEHESLFNMLYSTLDYVEDALQTTLLAYQSCLDNNISDVCTTERINFQINSISFYGSTGYVQYHNNSRVANTLLVLQYRRRDDDAAPIGVVYVNNQSVIQLWENETTIWPDGIPPDGTPIKVINILKTWITIYGSVLMAMSLTFAAICLCFNLIFRKRKVVKLISPNLNYIMILGAVMISICCFPIRTRAINTQTIDCVIDRLFSSLGYDICFGVAFVKLFRVYYIFKITSVKKRVLQDWKMVLVVIGLVLGDIVIAHPLFVAGIIKGDVNFVKDLQMPSDVNSQGVRREYYTISCGTSMLYTAYLVMTVLYKIVLHVIGLILAFMARKVEINVLNDYKSTSAIVYCSSFTIILLIVLSTIFVENPNADEIGFVTLIFITVMMFLGLTFIPKMVALYRDPEGMQIFDTYKSHNSKNGAISAVTNHKKPSHGEAKTDEIEVSADVV